MATQLFATTDGSFTVEIDDRGGKHWTPTLGGIRVDAAMPLDHARCVVLLDFHHEGRHLRDALRCIDADGLIVWLAQPVSSSDEYVSVRLDTRGISAASWDGFRVRIDPNTGRILESKFTK